MARRHYWQFLVTDEGNPIENAQISIYIAGTEDPAFVYTDEVGPAGTSTAPQVVTSKKGYYEFWIADSQEANGYFLDTKFKIAWAAPGVQSGFIDYIDVFSTSVAKVDETDTNELKNKAVSNFLAKGWEDHKDSIIYENNVLQIHGIGAVDESQWDATIADNTKLNRLVSNVLGNNWEGHANTIYNSTNDQWEYTIAGGPSTHADGVGGNPGSPHGIEFVDVTSTDTEKNRLVSNSLAKSWYDHTDETNQAVANTDHPQFPLLDGTRDFTSDIHGVSTTGGSTGTTLVTKDYVDGRRYTESIDSTAWTDNLDGTYSYTVLHNLGVDYPVVMLWDTSVLPEEVVQSADIKSIDTNTTEITVTSNVNHFVRILR